MGAEGALAAAQSGVEAARGEVVDREVVLEPAAAGGEVVRAEHPAGEEFFQGNGEAISDAEAEAIARGQLARSGLLKGQGVRGE